MPLTARQRRFIDEYLVDLNASQAALRAGYAPRTAPSMGHENLHKPEIQLAISARQQGLAVGHAVTPERVIQELALVAFANMADYAAWDSSGVTLKASTALTAAQTRVVGEVSQTISKDGGTVRFKLHSKVAALAHLGKHLGLFPDKVQIEIFTKLQQVRAMTDADLEALIAEAQSYANAAR